MTASVLYDEPGPRGKAVNALITVLTVAGIGAVGWWVYAKFDAKDQWNWTEKWQPIFQSDVWTNFLLPGIGGTLKAFALAAVLALVFGLVFGLGRMSDITAVRWTSGVVVEFFRSVPLVILMFGIYYIWASSLEQDPNVYMAVVVGLMLYNGSVLAEVLRAGVNALPKGQAEAGSAIGLRRGQVRLLIEMPQAVRAMLPAIIAQLVVLLKDTALGYILAYNELINQIDKISRGNTLQVVLVVMAIYIVMNGALSILATLVEKRLGRSKKTSFVAHVDPGMGAVPAAIDVASTGGGSGTTTT